MTLQSILEAQESKGKSSKVKVYSESIENLHADFEFADVGQLTLRTLQPDHADFALATQFYKSLSPESRGFFGPTNRFLPPNLDADKDFMLGKFPNYAFILSYPNGSDANRMVGKFFLRKFGEACGHYSDTGATAELGIGIADEHHGKSLGSLGMDILGDVGIERELDSIWLIHYTANQRGAALYQHKGYETVREFEKENPATHQREPATARVKLLK